MGGRVDILFAVFARVSPVSGVAGSPVPAG